jgi:hypothetical protein
MDVINGKLPTVTLICLEGDWEINVLRCMIRGVSVFFVTQLTRTAIGRLLIIPQLYCGLNFRHHT